MTLPIEVRLVESSADFNTFLTFRWKLYKGNPYWTPPLLAMERHKLDREHNPSWQHMEGDYFVAWRGAEPVGTIAAFINHRHNEYQNEHIGFFGMFDVIDDQDAANALLQTAANYVQARGYDAVRGPANFSTNDECGLLIKGFDDPPVLLMPYNFPYYQRLLDNAPGYHKVMDLFSYKFTLDAFHHSKNLEKSLRVTRRNNERRQIAVRTLNPKRISQELEIFRGMYNRAWEKNWGFVPLSDAELDAMIREMGQYIEPRLAFFAEVAGEPAGFMMVFPDMNQPLRYAYPRPGKPNILALLQAAWHWKVRSKIDRVRIPLMGVQAEYRRIGVEAALFARFFEEIGPLAALTHWKTADGGWVLETNTDIQRLVEPLGGEAYKWYRFYERGLTTEP